jgi:hypothetical protein
MIEIDKLSGSSRVWIYQADRSLNEFEILTVKNELAAFVDDWSSHGQKMQASAEVYYNRIVVIAADEVRALASGCGIDKSVNFMKEMQNQLGVDFFQRTQVLFKNDGKMVEAPLHHFWAMRKAGIIEDRTLIIDNTVRVLADLRTKWEVPFENSWHAEMWRR